MQKFILLVQLIFCSFPLIIWGQEVDKPIKRIGITCTGVGQNEVFTDPDLVGAPGYRGKGFWGAGMVFSQGINRWLEWETGMEFSRHRIEVVPNLPPNMDARTRIENSALITFPLSLKAGFLKYFFVSGGILLDLDAAPGSPIDSQTGFGAGVGAGAQYHFRSGLSLFVNPYVRGHSLLPLLGSKNHDSLWEEGIRIGLTVAL